MTEAVSHIVTQMPRGKRAGLLLLFLGPAVAIYSVFSIYPLIATMALSTYASDATGARHFVGLANFQTAARRRAVVEAVLERLRQQSDLLRRAHVRAEPDRHRARRTSEPAGPAG